MDGDTPQRVWTGKEVSYRHLKVFGCLAYVHVAKDRRGKLDPKIRPCVFLGYGDDEFGYRVWDPVDKKIFRSRDIIFMEDKTLADWESEKKIMNSESTGKDRFYEEQSQPARDRLALEDPTEDGEQTEPVDEELEGDTGTGPDPEMDSDEEQTEEPAAEAQGRRYPLRERRAPRRFPDPEHVLLTNEGEPESFEEAKIDTHSCK